MMSISDGVFRALLDSNAKCGGLTWIEIAQHLPDACESKHKVRENALRLHAMPP